MSEGMKDCKGISYSLYFLPDALDQSIYACIVEPMKWNKTMLLQKSSEVQATNNPTHLTELLVMQMF